LYFPYLLNDMENIKERQDEKWKDMKNIEEK
jgi:hypothetical protein